MRDEETIEKELNEAEVALANAHLRAEEADAEAREHMTQYTKAAERARDARGWVRGWEQKRDTLLRERTLWRKAMAFARKTPGADV